MSFDLRTTRAPAGIEFRLRLPLLVAGILVVTLLAGVTRLCLWATVRHYKEEIVAARGERAGLEAVVQRYELLRKLEASNGSEGDLLAAWPVRNVKWNLVLAEVGRVIPETVILTALRGDSGGRVTVEGRAESLEVIAQFGAGIQAAANLGSPTLSQAQRDQATGGYTFTLTFETKEVPYGG